jgi:nucleotide-binding universal stress UspA family protein
MHTGGGPTGESQMTTEQAWLLGLELSPRSGGALQFGRWLRGTLGARVVGVYVSELWLAGLPPDDGAVFLLTARTEAERWLDGLEAGTPRSPVDATNIVDAVDAETGLARAAHGAPGLVVGRRVAGDGALVRLGRVTRRLLRGAPAPVIVVPPELAVDEFRGPVVLASDFTDASVAAARFAASFARRLGRPLVCVHVGQPRWEESFAQEEPRWEELRRAYRESVMKAAHVWASAHCPGDALVIEYGDPQERLAAVAARLQACLLVVGSRRPGLLERFFAGSTSSAVAATASCAVAVVPAAPQSDPG